MNEYTGMSDEEKKQHTINAIDEFVTKMENIGIGHLPYGIASELKRHILAVEEIQYELEEDE